MFLVECTEHQQHPLRLRLLLFDELCCLTDTLFGVLRRFAGFHCVVKHHGQDKLARTVGNLLIQHVVFPLQAPIFFIFDTKQKSLSHQGVFIRRKYEAVALASSIQLFFGAHYCRRLLGRDHLLQI